MDLIARSKLILSVGYGVLFLTGAVGNALVILMIAHVFFTLRQFPTMRHSAKNVFVYVLGLSVADLIVIFHLPFLVIDMNLRNWIFGGFLCRLYWMGESVNKILSTFILTALSWDRYLAVCAPLSSRRYRTTKVACMVLGICAFLSAVLLSPVFLYADVVNVRMFDLINSTNETLENQTTYMRCSVQFSPRFEMIFVCYVFTAGYCIPAAIMLYFYATVLLKLFSQQQDFCAQRRRRVWQPRIRQVTARILSVVIFYFACWTPFWVLNLLIITGRLTMSILNTTEVALYYGSHLLICLNSSANPAFYALLNRELRVQHLTAVAKSRQSLTSTAHNTVDYIQQQGRRFSTFLQIRAQVPYPTHEHQKENGRLVQNGCVRSPSQNCVVACNGEESVHLLSKPRYRTSDRSRSFHYNSNSNTQTDTLWL